MNWSEMVRYEPTTKVIETVTSHGILTDDKGLDYLVLNTALECGRKDIADFCLSQNCKVNKSTRSSIGYNTPLHNAVLLEDLRLVNILLEKEALINARNGENNTPLHLAFLKRNSEITHALLAAMERSSKFENVKNKLGLTTLHIACTSNKEKVVKNLLKSNADLKDSVSDESLTWKGFTALHFAAEYKSSEAMRILVLVSTKADLTKKNGYKQTALQIINQHMESSLVMSDLLSLDTGSNSYKNFSNFHVSCARDDPEVVKNFLENGTPINTPVNKGTNICCQYAPIHFAIKRKSQENVKILIEQGADLSKKNVKGMTPLHLALYTEENGARSSFVDSLYESTRNKEANPKDNYDLNYLHVACTRNDVDLVKKLLESNADVNSKVTYTDKKFYNYTPLHFATLYENLEAVRLLIDQGADVNVCNGSHTGTPLLMAFYSGNKLLVDMLLSSGADPKAVRPGDKETTLNCLVYGYIARNDDELLPYVERLIMEFGVDVNAKDHEGDTALHIACENLGNAAPCVKLLLEFGADINAENDKGETPFMWVMNKKYNRDHGKNAADYAMLYHHVQKLKTFGLEVNEKNEGCCEQLMAKRKTWKIEDLSDDGLAFVEQERMKEVTRMKKVELVQHLSLYDLIMLTPERAATYMIEDVAGLNVGSTTASICSEFPVYGYLIRLQLRKIELVVRDPEAVVQIDERRVKRQRSEE